MNETWKTNVGMSIVGAAVGLLVSGLLSTMGMAGTVISAILTVLFIVYALVYYPSYFTDSPKLTSGGRFRSSTCLPAASSLAACGTTT